MARKSCRVHFIRHLDGNLSGTLLRTWGGFFDAAPPAAFSSSSEDVLRQLEVQLREREIEGREPLDRYFWDESFQARLVRVDIHPQSLVKKRAVVGSSAVPLRTTYVWSQVGEGAYRVILPRFGWSLILEDLDIAPEVVRTLISGALLGEQARWLYDFRQEEDEFVSEWSPPYLTGRDPSLPPPEPYTYPALSAVADDWVDAARRHRLPPVLSWRGFSAAETQMFARHPPTSVLLVGAAGVGKTTWVRALAEHLVRRNRLTEDSTHIWRTSGERLIAGMIYLGQWQKRCLDLVAELSFEGDWLYVDRLTSILSAQPDGGSVADVFLPAVKAGEISLIAECTEAELARCRQLAPALLAQFQVVRLEPPSVQDVGALLELYLHQRAPRLRVHPVALRRLLRYLDTFERHRVFPGKALQFADWLLSQEDRERERTMLLPDVTAAFSRYSGLPVDLISDEVSLAPETIASGLRERVVGQDEACGVAARALARFKVGLNDPEKPVASLFFVGPTGVGKTELAKQLARYQFGNESRLLRVDMSEFMTPGSAQRLLQIVPGVTSLAEQVRQQPLAVVLFDEIEKAHPEVFDLLLGVLGEGRLTDALGRLVDFRMTVIVMTSNLGTARTSPVGYQDASTASASLSEVRRFFRPEFFNRLDHVVPFRSLGRDELARILDLELAKAHERAGMARRGLRLRLEPDARAWLVARGDVPLRGARPLQRLVEETIVAPLAQWIAGDPPLRDREIRVSCEGDGIKLA